MTRTWAIVALGACLVGYPAVVRADDEPPEPCTTDVVAALNGQGQWLVAPGGTPAWQPNPAVVGYDFVPYQTGGEWEDQDGVEVFVSQWPWGDLVFNQGSWTFDPEAGWLWLPDPRCVQAAPTVAPDGQPLVLPIVLLPPQLRVVDHPFGGARMHPPGAGFARGRGRPLPARGPLPPQRARPVTVMPARARPPSRAPARPLTGAPLDHRRTRTR